MVTHLASTQVTFPRLMSWSIAFMGSPRSSSRPHLTLVARAVGFFNEFASIEKQGNLIENFIGFKSSLMACVFPILGHLEFSGEKSAQFAPETASIPSPIQVPIPIHPTGPGHNAPRHQQSTHFEGGHDRVAQGSHHRHGRQPRTGLGTLRCPDKTDKTCGEFNGFHREHQQQIGIHEDSYDFLMIVVKTGKNSI